MNDPQLAMAGSGGCYLVSGTDAVSKSFRNAVVMTDAVINTITDKREDGSEGSKTNYNFGTTTLVAGTVITCQGTHFTSIDLTSGSVMIYLL